MKFSLSLDTSQINQFAKCPYAWYLKYVRNLEPCEKRMVMAVGSFMHRMLEDYYMKVWENDSKAMVYTLGKIKEYREIALSDGLDKDYITLAIERYMAYLIYYESFDSRIKICDTYDNEKKRPAVEVGFSLPLVDNELFYFVLEGRIDLICYLNNTLFWMDHKTQTRRELLSNKSPQCRTYSLALNCNGIYNYIGMTQEVNKETFKRAMVTQSAREKQVWKQYLIKCFYKVAYAKMTGTFEQNFHACSGAFDRKMYECEFNRLCENDAAIRDNLISIYYKERKKWEPWALEGEENGI